MYAMGNAMKILVIDDDHTLRTSLRGFLEDCGRDVVLAEHGAEGLKLLGEDPEIGIVLVDLNMPVLDGYGFISSARKLRPHLPIIVLSGVGVLDDAIEAIRLGAWDFISKPVMNLDVLLHSLDSALEKATLIEENKRYQDHLEELVRIRTQQLEKANERVVHCLGKAAEFRDNDTGHHVVRTGEISVILATALDMGPDFTRLIRLAAPMHDVGKISIPDSILLKPGPLDDAQWEIMKRHTVYGCEMLHFDTKVENGGCTLSLLEVLAGQDDLISMAQRIALCHHERWDGRGYPNGLGGGDIPVEARIVSLVDVFDALGSARSYKKALPQELCRRKILEARGTYFEPAVVDAFERHYAEVVDVRARLTD